MPRIIVYTVPLLISLLAGSAGAQQWAQAMFEVRTHEFGTVARGAKAEYLFELTNKYKEDIHIAGVRASCGCATPSITAATLKTWEKGGILVKFNTRSFVGQRSATITVTIDRPYPAEVQLSVNGFIRGDVVLEPGVVSFGAVPQGSTPQQELSVKYAGRPDWKILDVRSGNTNLEVDMPSPVRSAGRAEYTLNVRLKEEMPAGYFTDQIILVTDDPNSRMIPITIEGNVVSALTVSPASLFMGIVEPGQTVTKQLVVRAADPFTIVDVQCEDDCFQFKPAASPKKTQLVPVTFTAGPQSGKVMQTITITTDLAGEISGTCIATATVKEADGEN